MIGMFYEDDILAVNAVVSALLPEKGILVEIGCFQGKSTVAWAEAFEANNKDFKIHAIDKFEGLNPRRPTQDELNKAKAAGLNVEYMGSDERMEHMEQFKCTGEEQYSNFKKNTERFDNITVQKKLFTPKFEWNVMVDCVFYDADHNYQACKDALEYWQRRLVKGGIMCVHDNTPNWPGTQKAIKEVYPNAEVEVVSKQGFTVIRP